MSTKYKGQLILWLLSLAIVSTSSSKYPVIIVPGMWGSQIDAKFNQPEKVPHKCGIQPNVFTNIWFNTSWIGPLTIDCLIDNMKLKYNKDSRTTENMTDVDIRVPGWGKSYPVENIDPKLSTLGRYFGTLCDTLVANGLVRDVSIRSAPYDFRKAPNENIEFFNHLEMLTQETFMLNNNKPVVFIAHNIGGHMVLLFLQRQLEKWKKKYVRSFISLAVPWGGSVSALKTFFDGGDNLGFNKLDARDIGAMSITFPSVLWLLPSPYIWDNDEVLVETETKNFTVEDEYKSFFESIDYMTGYEIYQNVKTFTRFDPPGVEAHCLYGTGISTVFKIKYGSGEFVLKDAKYTFGHGDGSVNISSLRGCAYWRKNQNESVVLREFYGVDHQKILNDQTVIDYIMELMKTF